MTHPSPKRSPATDTRLQSTAGRTLPAMVMAIALHLTACGYHLPGDRVSLPEDVRSISIGRIENQSREYGLEKTLAFALEREIAIRHQLRVVDEPAGGDAVLSGKIHEVNVRPVAFDSNDLALQYEIVLIVDLALKRQSDGQILWRVSGLRESDEYSTSANVVVTSSSQFQQGTLDAANIQNPQFTSIQLAETERRRAITRLLQQMARDVYNQMVEEF